MIATPLNSRPAAYKQLAADAAPSPSSASPAPLPPAHQSPPRGAATGDEPDDVLGEIFAGAALLEADDASLSDVDADLDDLVPPSDDLGAFHRDVLVGLAGGAAADFLAFGAAARAACAGAPAGAAVCAAHASACRHLLGEADVAGSGLSDVAAILRGDAGAPTSTSTSTSAVYVCRCCCCLRHRLARRLARAASTKGGGAGRPRRRGTWRRCCW